MIEGRGKMRHFIFTLLLLFLSSLTLVDASQTKKNPVKFPIKSSTQQIQILQNTFRQEMLDNFSALSMMTKKEKSAVKKAHIFTVVIDAGHGGKDSGALGSHGIEEKKVVLAIAKKLAKEINRSPHLH